MTEQNQTTETTDEQTPLDPQETPTDAPEGTEDTEAGTGKAHKDAAKYRTRLREVEGERDALTEQVTALQRREVERVATEHLANPAGLWAAGVDVAALLAEDGTPDPARIKEAALSAVDTLGLARPKPGNYVPSEGSNPRAQSSDGMASVIRG